MTGLEYSFTLLYKFNILCQFAADIKRTLNLEIIADIAMKIATIGSTKTFAVRFVCNRITSTNLQLK